MRSVKFVFFAAKHHCLVIKYYRKIVIFLFRFCSMPVVLGMVGLGLILLNRGHFMDQRRRDPLMNSTVWKAPLFLFYKLFNSLWRPLLLLLSSQFRCIFDEELFLVASQHVCIYQVVHPSNRMVLHAVRGPSAMTAICFSVVLLGLRLWSAALAGLCLISRTSSIWLRNKFHALLGHFVWRRIFNDV